MLTCCPFLEELSPESFPGAEFVEVEDCTGEGGPGQWWRREVELGFKEPVEAGNFFPQGRASEAHLKGARNGLAPWAALGGELLAEVLGAFEEGNVVQ